MRDAFGGVFTMNLLLVFIFIFVAFGAVSLNYAKAFRVKNSVIDFIEENEIIDLQDISNKVDKLDLILKNSEYYKTCNGSEEQQKKSESGQIIEYCYGGVAISIKSTEPIEGTDKSIIKYNITTLADWNLGALNKILALAGQSESSNGTLSGTWTIRGEAKVVAINK